MLIYCISFLYYEHDVCLTISWWIVIT